MKRTIGAEKSQGRLSLEKYNVVELFRHNTFNEIARAYGISASTVQAVANEQFKQLQVNKFEFEDFKVEFDGIKGTWINSNERKYYKQKTNEYG
jgi:DNA invertase Pin-like site-specific DNA recombinase